MRARSAAGNLREPGHDHRPRADNTGGTLARPAVDVGYDVVLSNSRGHLIEQAGLHSEAAAPPGAAAGELSGIGTPDINW